MMTFLERWRACAGGFALCKCIGGATVAAAPILTGTDTGPVANVRSFEGSSSTPQANFTPYGPSFTGGVRVAAGDVNGDTFIDIITGPGPGGGPHVKVFDGQTLGEVSSFFVYDPSFSGGVNVAAGDVNGDGRADIITGAGPGGGPHVKVFSGASQAGLHDFFAFGSFTGGVRVAAGDVNGDGCADIVTGTGAGGGHVKVFDGVSGAEIRSFLPYDSGFTGGVFVAAGDVNGDGRADLVTGTDDSGSAPGHVKVFDGSTGGVLHSFTPFGGFTGGVRVATGDIDGDGLADIITGTGPGGGHVKAYDGVSLDEQRSFFPYGSFTGGVFVGGFIPEPGSAALLAAAGAATLLRRRRAVAIARRT